MIQFAQAESINQTGMRPTRRRLLLAVVRRRPPIEVVLTLAVILAANIAVGIAAVRGETDVLRSFVQTLGGVLRVAIVIALGVVGVATLLFAGFVLPELLEPGGDEPS